MSTSALRAAAGVRVTAGAGGVTRWERLRSAPPLALRTGAGVLWLVGSSAGPLPGDEVSLELDVGPGARLEVRASAASVALGGGGDDESWFRVDARVAPGGTLRWLSEPTVAAAGCHHRVQARIQLAADARLVWRDELVLGRYGESPGRLCSRIDVEVDGRAILRQEVGAGTGSPGWAGPAVLAGCKAAGTVVVVAPGEALEPGSLGPEVAVMDLAGGGYLISAVAADAVELRRRLDEALAGLAGSSFRP